LELINIARMPMFEDDPEMQQVLAASRAMPRREKKPGWWASLSFGLLVAGGGAMAGLGYGLGWNVWAACVFGALAGIACSWAVFGYSAGRYRFTSGPREGERIVLWTPIAPVRRVLAALAVPLLLLVGAGIAYKAAEMDAEQAKSRRTPAAVHGPPVRPGTR
jgi:hypothetical protein